MDVCFSVDLGGTWIKFGMFDAEGSLLEKWQASTPQSDLIFPQIAGTIKEKAGQHGIALADILGVGLGVPGPVHSDGYAEVLVNLHLKDINVSRVLSGLLRGVPVFAANDANAAALGEMWRGAGRGCGHMMLITLGTGVGSGLIADGRLLNGFRGVAGEIGHIVVNPRETEFCNCGAKGCLDQIASATGLVRYTKKLLNAAPQPQQSSLSGLPRLTAKDIMLAAEQGDSTALAAVHFTMEFLGKMMADVGQIIDPELFVIGGGLSNAGLFLLDIIKQYYSKYSIFSEKKARIALAELGNDAGIYGTAKLVLGKQ